MMGVQAAGCNSKIGSDLRVSSFLWSGLGLSDVKNIGEGRTEEMSLGVSMISIDWPGHGVGMIFSCGALRPGHEIELETDPIG